ncbi:MAG: MFS transporter [Proteobacteria bacterium]|nr:MFS transporter [Pseudomonadota bacterium]
MTAAAVDVGEGLPPTRRAITVAVLVCAIIMSVSSGVIANVALPVIAATLAISDATSIWIVNAYQLAIVVGLLPFAALGEAVGFRRVFIGGLTLFTAASGVCALTTDFASLVAARSAMGLGAGALMAVSSGVLRHSYPARLLGLAIGINALFASLSSALAPTLGAALLTVASWPWLFGVNLPIGLLALLLTPALPKTLGRPRRTSLVSVALNGVSLALLILAIDRLGRAPLAAAAMLAVAAICFTALLLREAGRATPLVPLDLLRMPTFRLSVVASSCAFGSQMMGFVALPFLLHDAGFETMTIGYLLMPWPLTVAVSALLAGRLSDRHPSWILCALGGGLMALGLASIALWPVGERVGSFIVLMAIGGLGFGLFQTPNNRNMILSAPRERAGAAGGMQAMARQFGTAAGTAIVALIFSSVATLAPPPPLALGVAAAFASTAALLSFLRR